MSYISVSKYFVTASGMFFSLLIQQNPVGLYHPHPLYPAFSKKRHHDFSQQVPLLCVCGQTLGTAEVQTCQTSITGTFLGRHTRGLCRLSLLTDQQWRALTGVTAGMAAQSSRGEGAGEGENPTLQQPVELHIYSRSFVLTRQDSRVKRIWQQTRKLLILKMILELGEADSNHPPSHQSLAESSVKSAAVLSHERRYVKKYNWNGTDWKHFPTAHWLSF